MIPSLSWGMVSKDQWHREVEGTVRGSSVFKITLEEQREGSGLLSDIAYDSTFYVKIYHRDPSMDDGYDVVSSVYDSYTEAIDAYNEVLRKYHFVDDNASSANNDADKKKDIPII